MTRTRHITGRGVDASVVDRIGARFTRRPANTAEPMEITVFDGSTETDLAALLAPPATVCLDAQCSGDSMAELPRAALLLRISTATATHLDVANAFTGALAARLPHLDRMAADIRYAVQEAIGNAVIHGNLGLDGAMRASMEELRQFATDMERRLGDPAYAHLPITIAARRHGDGVAISVEDSGGGFHHPSVRPPASAAAGGLGLTIIRKCCRRLRFSRDGRRITMVFG